MIRVYIEKFKRIYFSIDEPIRWVGTILIGLVLFISFLANALTPDYPEACKSYAKMYDMKSNFIETRGWGDCYVLYKGTWIRDTKHQAKVEYDRE